MIRRRFASCLLGSDVRQRSERGVGEHRISCVRPGTLECTRETEVGDDSPVLREQNIFGDEVAVHEPSAMRVHHGAGNIAQHGDALVEPDRTLLDALTQREAAHEWHRVVVQSGRRLPNRENGNGVWLLQ